MPSTGEGCRIDFGTGVDPQPDDALRRGPLWREWLLTARTGGFAMGTAAATPTRRYHALLIAARTPPVDRIVALAHLDEEVACGVSLADGHRTRLTPFRFVGHPAGEHAAALSFERYADRCVWRFNAQTASGTAIVTKTVRLIDDPAAWSRGCLGAVEIEWVVESPGPWRLNVRPLVGLRDFHALVALGTDAGAWGVQRVGEERVVVSNAVGTLGLEFACSSCVGFWRQGPARDARGQVDAGPVMWRGLEYAWEALRGQDECAEDLLCPATLEVDGSGSGAVRLIAWVGEPARALPDVGSADATRRDAAERAERLDRMASAVATEAAAPGAGPSSASDDDAELLARLAVAADDFVVRRAGTTPGTTLDATSGTTVIAGYPWFADWGRDTMISLPGLLLCTGRHEEAFGALATFAGALGRGEYAGLIPNRFDDFAGPAHYNTVDAPLWFIHACCEWARASGDAARFARDLLPACMEVVEGYQRGTAYGIGVDPADGLVTAGDETTQLTWMDAKRDGVVFTPRHGKAVEINALWHHGLVSLSGFASPRVGDELRVRAERVFASFQRVFSGGPGGQPVSGLIDCVTPVREGGRVRWRASQDIRPNQVFAAALQHAPVTLAQRTAVVRVAREHLLTSAGLRTLAPTNVGYRARFEGPIFERDAAYHQGTVWPWLIGAYAEAVCRAGEFSLDARREAADAVRAVAARITTDGLGQLWEVYDADEPRRPDGCIAQAWSAAECLRGLVLATKPV